MPYFIPGAEDLHGSLFHGESFYAARCFHPSLDELNTAVERLVKALQVQAWTVTFGGSWGVHLRRATHWGNKQLYGVPNPYFAAYNMDPGIGGIEIVSATAWTLSAWANRLPRVEWMYFPSQIEENDESFTFYIAVDDSGERFVVGKAIRAGRLNTPSQFSGGRRDILTSSMRHNDPNLQQIAYVLAGRFLFRSAIQDFNDIVEIMRVMDSPNDWEQLLRRKYADLEFLLKESKHGIAAMQRTQHRIPIPECEAFLAEYGKCHATEPSTVQAAYALLSNGRIVDED